MSVAGRYLQTYIEIDNSESFSEICSRNYLSPYFQRELRILVRKLYGIFNADNLMSALHFRDAWRIFNAIIKIGRHLQHNGLKALLVDALEIMITVHFTSMMITNTEMTN